MTVSLIAAMDRRGAIGIDNTLPWRLPDDLARFKALTLGKPVLMGRKTAESLGRALPGRRNLVLTRSGRAPFADMQPVASLESVLAELAGAELMVIGGGEIYALAAPHATRMHITHVYTVVEDADAFFPVVDMAQWRETARTAHAIDARHPLSFEFVDYERLPGPGGARG